MKEAFEEEMNGRIRAALEEKYKKMMKKEADHEEVIIIGVNTHSQLT